MKIDDLTGPVPHRAPGLFTAASIANSENFTTFCTPAGEQFASIFRRHARAEAMLVGALASAGLVSAFH